MEGEVRREKQIEQEPQQKTHVVVMLGPRMQRRSEREGERWMFPLVATDKGTSVTNLPVEVAGGFGRMRAIQGIYEDFKERREQDQRLLFLITGGTDKKSGVSQAQEASRQLVQEYGVPQDMLVALRSPLGTMTNALAAVEYLKEHKEDIGNVSEIEIVTQDFHMLRAWLIFTKEIYTATTGKELIVSQDDIEKIKKILEESFDDADSSKAREQVMAIIKPYIQDAVITIKPRVVEDILVSKKIDGEPRFQGGERYAQMIKQNPWVQETRKWEAKGIVDLLEKKYQVS